MRTIDIYSMNLMMPKPILMGIAEVGRHITTAYWVCGFMPGFQGTRMKVTYVRYIQTRMVKKMLNGFLEKGEFRKDKMIPYTSKEDASWQL